MIVVFKKGCVLNLSYISLFVFLLSVITCPVYAQLVSVPTEVNVGEPVRINYLVSGSTLKKVNVELSTVNQYAHLSIMSDDNMIADNIDVPSTGTHNLSALVSFPSTGDVEITLSARDGDIVVNSLSFEDVNSPKIPQYVDASDAVGLDTENSHKYGGPTIADMDNDGYYDFIFVNHNDVTNKLFWNNGDGTVRRHDKDLSQWKQQDLHGAAAGDYDNDGDLDLVMAIGGGNGTSPKPPVFYRNDNGKLILATGDVEITKGARGRAARWSDMDLDGDLDLMLFNAKGIAGETPQHIFYRNKGDGTFEDVSVPSIENINLDRVVVTDLDGDNIDDIVLFGFGIAIWKGNGDFTYSNLSSQLPTGIASTREILAATDIDIDNDGDFDLYFARGKSFGTGNTPSVDYNPEAEQLDMKVRWTTALAEMDMTADGSINIHDFEFGGRNPKTIADFPVFLGSAKSPNIMEEGGNLEISSDMADGWPSSRSESGIYIGYLGDGDWKASIVNNNQSFWSLSFSILDVTSVTPEFVPTNRNVDDILLRNDGGSFTDVTDEWNIPSGGNHLGVTVGDFNNDGFNDLFLHRWGFITSKPADYILLNTGEGSFDTTTAHGASDPDDEGHGDMGQAFDFDLDGDLDLLNGSDERGKWYLYENDASTMGNYALVEVGYAPQSNVDAISAEVILTTSTQTYRKRVGSSGAVYSQSLMNIVHFGLGEEEVIENITIKWRDGETTEFNDKIANQLFDTDSVDPIDIEIIPNVEDVRINTAIELEISAEPINANAEVIWTSSDPSIASVDENGKVTGHIVDEQVTITAKSVSNDVFGTAIVSVVDFFPINVESVTLDQSDQNLFVGKSIQLSTVVAPKYADDQAILWSTSDELIATVDENGLVSAHAEGTAVIRAESNENSGISDEINVHVAPLVSAFVAYDDEAKYTTTDYEVGGEIPVSVDYHAGSGNTVATSDQGGVRIWLREMKENWVPANDIIYTDESALGKESGTSSNTFSLEGMTATEDLPEGNFYFIFASFVSSAGENVNKGIVGVNIVEGVDLITSVEEETHQLGIYPNPTYYQIVIKGEKNTRYTVQVYDVLGTKHIDRPIYGDSGFSIQHLPEGIYMVTVSDHHTSKSFKLKKK